MILACEAQNPTCHSSKRAPLAQAGDSLPSLQTYITNKALLSIINI